MKRHLPNSVTRRDILRYTLAGVGLTALGPMSGVIPIASGDPLPNHKRLVVLFCDGGYDGLNVLVPINSDAYYQRRPLLAIPEAQALDIGELDYRLAPSLPRLATLFNDGNGAAIRHVGYPDENLSHFTSTDVHSYGIRQDFETVGIPQSGWMARYADLYAPTPLGAASFGVGRHPILNGGSFQPFQSDDLANFKFEDGGISTQDSGHRMSAIRDILGSFAGTGMSAETFTAIDQAHQLVSQVEEAVQGYNSTVRDQYPVDPPGPYLKDIARVIQAGFETRVFFTSFPGFDTHAQQPGRLPLLLSLLDNSVGTFVDDLKEMGAFDDTLILVVTEFGRRIFENAAGGTDHGHGNVHLAVGGGVNSGLYGPDQDESELETSDWLGYSVDYRDVLRAAIGNHLGHDPEPIFPEEQEFTTSLGFV